MATASRPRIDEETVERINTLLDTMNRHPEHMTFQHKIEIIVEEAEETITEKSLQGRY
jgi:hypothetical protein